tara:strand:- start:138 stop:368 length:231 start_codon:yes stop_codon:yes gene_type:complete
LYSESVVVIKITVPSFLLNSAYIHCGIVLNRNEPHPSSAAIFFAMQTAADNAGKLSLVRTVFYVPLIKLKAAKRRR